MLFELFEDDFLAELLCDGNAKKDVANRRVGLVGYLPDDDHEAETLSEVRGAVLKCRLRLFDDRLQSFEEASVQVANHAESEARTNLTRVSDQTESLLIRQRRLCCEACRKDSVQKRWRCPRCTSGFNGVVVRLACWLDREDLRFLSKGLAEVVLDDVVSDGLIEQQRKCFDEALLVQVSVDVGCHLDPEVSVLLARVHGSSLVEIFLGEQ